MKTVQDDDIRDMLDIIRKLVLYTESLEKRIEQLENKNAENDYEYNGA